MKYSYDLIHTDNGLNTEEGLYSLILLRASSLSITLNEVRCYLDGNYLLCLSEEDTLEYHSGTHDCLSLRFLPYFYNVNLSHRIIKNSIYEKMRSKYGYPSFFLFCERNDKYFGVVRLSDEEYNSIRLYTAKIAQHIDEHDTDSRWSCNARSDMISILNIAENAHHGIPGINENPVIRYIRENPSAPLSLAGLCEHFKINRTTLSDTIKKLTGLTPMQYVLEERLNQTRPELLFTNIAIGDLATKYGFGDVNYYIRTFKKHFGVTPLQYRTEGKNERIQNQNKYHLTKEQTMTVAEFESYLKKGLGRAVLLLKKETDRSVFRQAVIDHALKDSRYDRQSENPHAEYLLALLDCFEDKDAMIAEILAAYKEECEPSDRCYHIENLEVWMKLNIQGARERLWETYHHLLDLLKTEENPLKNGPDHERDDMEYAATVLYPASPGSLRHFLHNAIILTAESPRYNIVNFSEFVRDTKMIADIRFYPTFDNIRDEDPRAEMVYKAYVEYNAHEVAEREARRQPSSKKPEKKIKNWRELFDHELGSERNAWRTSIPSTILQGLSDQEHAEIIKLLSEEKDLSKKAMLLLHIRRVGKEILKNPCIDPLPLISELKEFASKEQTLNEKEQFGLRQLAMTIALIKHPAVRDLALRALPLSLKYPDSISYSYAFEATLTNYQPGDSEMLVKYIQRVSDLHALHDISFYV